MIWGGYNRHTSVNNESFTIFLGHHKKTKEWEGEVFDIVINEWIVRTTKCPWYLNWCQQRKSSDTGKDERQSNRSEELLTNRIQCAQLQEEESIWVLLRNTPHQIKECNQGLERKSRRRNTHKERRTNYERWMRRMWYWFSPWWVSPWVWWSFQRGHCTLPLWKPSKYMSLPPNWDRTQQNCVYKINIVTWSTTENEKWWVCWEEETYET